jgi:hypothetical protein
LEEEMQDEEIVPVKAL